MTSFSGGEEVIRVVVPQTVHSSLADKIREQDDVRPEAIYENLNLLEVDPTSDFKVGKESQLISVVDGMELNAITAFRLLAARLEALGANNPIVLKGHSESQCSPSRSK